MPCRIGCWTCRIHFSSSGISYTWALRRKRNIPSESVYQGVQVATCLLGLIALAWRYKLQNIVHGQFRHCREIVENLSMSSRDKSTFPTLTFLTRHESTYFQQPCFPISSRNDIFTEMHFVCAKHAETTPMDPTVEFGLLSSECAGLS